MSDGSSQHVSADRPVIVGGGIAGLMTALHLAPAAGRCCCHSAPLGAEPSSAWAQGGIAAALGADDDPALHPADTLAAGDGLCDPAVARRIVAGGARLHRRAGAAGRRASTATPMAASRSAWRPRTAAAASSMPAATAPAREIMRALTAAVRAHAVDHGARRRRGAPA